MSQNKNRDICNTQSIVLMRTNFGEADRIVTFITRDYGKVRAIAKAVRKERSKLAGGIELFSISDISFVPGRGELATLTSARLVSYYDTFMNDLAKVDFAYNCIKQLNKFTPDDVGEEYFVLLKQLFVALNEPRLTLAATQVWWYVQFCNVTGHAINLENTGDGTPFSEGHNYNFDGEHACFSICRDDGFNAKHIKYLRLALIHGPLVLSNVQGGPQLATDIEPQLKLFLEYQL